MAEPSFGVQAELVRQIFLHQACPRILLIDEAGIRSGLHETCLELAGFGAAGCTVQKPGADEAEGLTSWRGFMLDLGTSGFKVKSRIWHDAG